MQNYNTNFVNPYIQRLQNMEQQFYQPQQQTQPIQQQNFFRTLLVSNVEEANATQVAFDGTPTFFYNASKGEIYLKKISTQTGLVEFSKFALAQSPTGNEKVCKCANISEQQLKAINDKLDGLISIVGNKDDVQPKKEVKSAK